MVLNCYVLACFKRSEKRVNSASDLYFIEYNQILNRTGVHVESLYGLTEWNPWIKIIPSERIRIRAAQTIDENATFSYASSRIASCVQYFCYYNVSSRVLGINWYNDHIVTNSNNFYV